MFFNNLSCKTDFQVCVNFMVKSKLSTVLNQINHQLTMKPLFSILWICLSFLANSQGFLSSQKIQTELSGFVRNDFIYDSRKNLDACDHLLEMYPLRPVYDAKGEDINARGSANFLNTFTRFGTKFSGLELGKAKVSAYVEIDFTGGTQTPTLRLRHANTQFVWPKTRLLFGRAWHPTFIEKVYPATLNENTGLPFQVFNRSPQLRLTYELTTGLDVIAAAVYQYDYSNGGYLGKSYQYQRDAVIPELHGQIQYYNEHWVLGAAIDGKTIIPRTYTTGQSQSIHKANEKLNTMSALAYLKYTRGSFMLMAKSMYGQNLCESLLPGYYAVRNVNSITGAETYTPSNHLFNWVNFTIGKIWKFGVYAGYMKNYGTSHNPAGPFYGTATDIDVLTKISPQLTWNYKTFSLGMEWSWTTAAYGEPDLNDRARVKNTENVTNFRNMIAVIYHF